MELLSTVRLIFDSAVNILAKIPSWSLLPVSIVSLLLSVFFGILQGSSLKPETETSLKCRAYLRCLSSVSAGVCFFLGNAEGIFSIVIPLFSISIAVFILGLLFMIPRFRIWGTLELVLSVISSVSLGSFCSKLGELSSAGVLFSLLTLTGLLIEWILYRAISGASSKLQSKTESDDSGDDNKSENKTVDTTPKNITSASVISSNIKKRKKKTSPEINPEVKGNVSDKDNKDANDPSADENHQTASPDQDNTVDTKDDITPDKTDFIVSPNNVNGDWQDEVSVSLSSPDNSSIIESNQSAEENTPTDKTDAIANESTDTDHPVSKSDQVNYPETEVNNDSDSKIIDTSSSKKPVIIPPPDITLNVCTVGPHGSGKTTLTSAITAICSVYGSRSYSVSELDSTKEEIESGQTIEPSMLEYTSLTRHYYHIDTPGKHSYYKNTLRGINEADAAILVVAFQDRPSKAREYILMVGNAGIKRLILFINKCDCAEATADEIMLREKQYEDLVSDTEVDFDYVRIVSGSALGTISDDERWRTSVRNLVSAMDSCSVPKFNIMLPFRMSIGKVYGIMGRGTVVTGRINEGRIKVGDTVLAVGYGMKDVSTVIESIEVLGKETDSAKAGDCVGIKLKGILPGDVSRGQILCVKESSETHKRIGAEFRYLYYRSSDRTGRPKSLWNDTSLQYWFGNTEVNGKFWMHEEEYHIPGDDFVTVIDFDKPIPLRNGDVFSARKGSQTVGFGKVLKTD